jgi:hypothetical protein
VVPAAARAESAAAINTFPAGRGNISPSPCHHGDGPTLGARSGLERVKKERDDYRAMAADLLKRHFGENLDELETDLRDLQQKGGIPLAEALATLKTEFGLPL